MLTERETGSPILKSVCRGFVGLFLVVALASCSGSNENAGRAIEFTNGTFTETLIETQLTSKFAEIYSSVLPSLTPDQVSGKTLFAPIDSAMENFLSGSSETLEGIISKPEIALKLVLSHLAEQEFSATELLNMNGETLMILSGSTPSVESSEGVIRIVGGSGNSVKLIAVNLPSSDGVVHIIDGVLQP